MSISKCFKFIRKNKSGNYKGSNLCQDPVIMKQIMKNQ